jgi:hypothetical protein
VHLSWREVGTQMYHVNLLVRGFPCCRVKDTKDGEAFRGREQIGSWPRKGRGKVRNSGAYDDSYIIVDENNQLSANWKGA